MPDRISLVNEIIYSQCKIMYKQQVNQAHKNYIFRLQMVHWTLTFSDNKFPHNNSWTMRVFPFYTIVAQLNRREHCDNAENHLAVQDQSKLVLYKKTFFIFWFFISIKKRFFMKKKRFFICFFRFFFYFFFSIFSILLFKFMTDSQL